MSKADHQLNKKYILDLLMFYGASPKNINNNKLKNYLMSRHLYPGSNGYRIIENYFMSKLILHRGIFSYINQRFNPFTKQLYNLYNVLSNQNISNHKIIKYRNLLTDFYCWMILNDLFDFKMLNVNICLDYIHTNYYASKYSVNDLDDFGAAIDYYYKIYHQKNFGLKFKLKTMSLYQFTHEFTQIEMSNVYQQIHNMKLKLLLTLILNSGLPMRILVNTKINDLDLYNQCLLYSGYYSGKSLAYSFDQSLKLKIIKLLTLCDNNELYIFDSSYDSHRDDLYNEFTFALLNARIPAAKAQSILMDLHNAVLNKKFYKN